MPTAVLILAYVADLAIIASYYMTTRDTRYLRWMNAANAFGAVPILIVAVGVGAWPTVAVTIFFGIIGWKGLIQQIKGGILNP